MLAPPIADIRVGEHDIDRPPFGSSPQFNPAAQRDIWLCAIAVSGGTALGETLGKGRDLAVARLTGSETSLHCKVAALLASFSED